MQPETPTTIPITEPISCRVLRSRFAPSATRALSCATRATDRTSCPAAALNHKHAHRLARVQRRIAAGRVGQRNTHILRHRREKGAASVRVQRTRHKSSRDDVSGDGSGAQQHSAHRGKPRSTDARTSVLST